MKTNSIECRRVVDMASVHLLTLFSLFGANGTAAVDCYVDGGPVFRGSKCDSPRRPED